MGMKVVSGLVTGFRDKWSGNGDKDRETRRECYRRLIETFWYPIDKLE